MYLITKRDPVKSVRGCARDDDNCIFPVNDERRQTKLFVLLDRKAKHTGAGPPVHTTPTVLTLG